MIDLVRQAGAEIVGMGFLIEKAFQHGREAIAGSGSGIRVESLAVIESLEGRKIRFK